MLPDHPIHRSILRLKQLGQQLKWPPFFRWCTFLPIRRFTQIMWPSHLGSCQFMTNEVWPKLYWKWGGSLRYLLFYYVWLSKWQRIVICEKLHSLFCPHREWRVGFNRVQQVACWDLIWIKVIYTLYIWFYLVFSRELYHALSRMRDSVKVVWDYSLDGLD